MIDRRVFHRKPVPFCATAKFYEDGKQRTENLSLVNISEGGACLAFKHPVKRGSVFNLELVGARNGFINELGFWDLVCNGKTKQAVSAVVLWDRDIPDELENHHVGVQFNSNIALRELQQAS